MFRFSSLCGKWKNTGGCETRLDVPNGSVVIDLKLGQIRCSERAVMISFTFRTGTLRYLLLLWISAKFPYIDFSLNRRLNDVVVL